jgi:hypothetical protein
MMQNVVMLCVASKPFILSVIMLYFVMLSVVYAEIELVAVGFKLKNKQVLDDVYSKVIAIQ